MSDAPLQDFELRARDPQTWLSAARQLLSAADTMNASLIALSKEHEDHWREAQVGSLKAAMLLAGLALENALKALAVARGSLSIELGALRLKGPFGDHNLSGMARTLGVFEDEASRDLLRRLTAAVRWAARYPVPKSGAQMPDGGVVLSFLYTDIEATRSLLAEVEAWIPAA